MRPTEYDETPECFLFRVALLRTRGCTPCDASHLSLRTHERHSTANIRISFILKEKTEEAKRLLRYSEKSLSAISAYLGFSSHGHFARVFKKYAGMTPGEYREKHR